MAVTAAERQARAVAILERRNRYQFGQKNANLVLQSGCSDTNVQMIVLISTGKDVSLNNVRLRSGAPIGKPTTIDQTLRSLASFGLGYATSNVGARSVIDIARNKGPVFICYQYWSHPQWKGYKYAGRTLHGTATNSSGKLVNVGLSIPVGKSGLTQWTFRGRHSALVVGGEKSRGGTEYAIIRDPNHNSPARPERPAYDMVTVRQLERMLRSWGPSRLVLVPKRASNPPNVPSGPVKPGQPKPGGNPWDEPWLDPEDSTDTTVTTAGPSSLSGVGMGVALLAGAAIVGMAAIAAAMKSGEDDDA